MRFDDRRGVPGTGDEVDRVLGIIYSYIDIFCFESTFFILIVRYFLPHRF
jgi:hypothetical protein